MQFEEVARSALAAVDCDASYVLTSQWAAERYQQVCSRIRPRFLRELGWVTTPAVYTTGTITATRGSEIIAGAATAWTPALVGRFLRVRVNWYKVVSVPSTTSLVLNQPFSEDDAAAVSYRIVARLLTLQADARWISNDVVHPRFRRPLDKITLAEMDTKYPGRDSVGPQPYEWCQTPDELDADGKKCITIEVYPYPTQAEMLAYAYWKAPPLHAMEDEVPREIDGYQLKEGVLINVMQYNAAQCANPQSPKFNIEAAGYWRNEFRQQNTTWERIILDIAKNDKGVDDSTFILQMTRSHGSWRGGIHTAHDEVWSRGRRP